MSSSLSPWIKRPCTRFIAERPESKLSMTTQRRSEPVDSFLRRRDHREIIRPKRRCRQTRFVPQIYDGKIRPPVAHRRRLRNLWAAYHYCVALYFGFRPQKIFVRTADSKTFQFAAARFQAAIRMLE